MIAIFLQAAAPEGSMMPTMIMMQEKNFQETLKVGSRVVTTSGMHGRIAQILEDGIVLETLSGKLKFEKAAISREFTQQRFPDSAPEEKK